MASVLSAARRRLPPPVAERLQRLRSGVAHLVAGAEIHKAKVEAVGESARAIEAARHELHVAVDDLLERQDLILSSYDRRVAAIANRVLDLEEQLRAHGRAGDDPVAATVVAEHERGGHVNGADGDT